jgi:carbon monoxide dehydrogenase subunit G
MNLRGRRTLAAPRPALFRAILDPDTLLRVIPGCREIELGDDGEYRGLISLRLPGIAGSYRTRVRVVDAQEPDHGELEGEVTGALGTVTGRATFRLTEAGPGTIVDYEGRATIGGPLARLDSRFVEGLARSLIDQGLDTLDARIKADPVGTATGGGPVREEIPR